MEESADTKGAIQKEPTEAVLKPAQSLLQRIVQSLRNRRPTPATDWLPVRTSGELLARDDRAAHLRRICSLISVSDVHLATLCLPAITNYARFVQQLPASEAHHHAAPGGLLDHGLEVVTKGPALRRGYLLPQGGEPELLVRKQDLWTYAVFAAALLHDVGKPAVDQRIELFGSDGKPLGRWDPWQGAMRGSAAWYRAAFVRDRKRGLHERVAPLLVRFIVPTAGLSWLGSDPEVLAAWVAAISGNREEAGVLGEIVGRADGESVACNLGAGDVP